jgi:hypothetical protein
MCTYRSNHLHTKLDLGFYFFYCLATLLVLFFSNIGKAAQIEPVYEPSQLFGYGSQTFTLEDFEDPTIFTPVPNPDGPGYQAYGRGGVTYSSEYGVDIAPAAMWADGVTPSGARGLIANYRALDFYHEITFTFDSPINSFGLWFGDDDTCCVGEYHFNQNYNDVYFGLTPYVLGDISIFGNPIGWDTFSLQLNMNDAADQFLGFNSHLPITSVTLSCGIANVAYRCSTCHEPGTTLAFVPYIDDVQFNVIDVPETSTLLLMTTGIAALVVAGWRGKQLYHVNRKR